MLLESPIVPGRSEPETAPTRTDLEKAKSSGFDPAKGHQSPWTGVIGGLLLLSYILIYSIFQDNVLAHGGPAINFPITAMSGFFSLGTLSRNILDLPFAALIVFLFMASWEACKSPGRRVFLSAGSLIFLSAGIIVSLDPGGHIFLNSLAGGFTGFEKVLAGHLLFLLFFLMVLFPNSIRTGRLRVRRTWRQALKTSFIRWVSSLAVLFAAVTLFSSHPLFFGENFRPWKTTAVFLLTGYGILGWPYSFITNLLRSGPAEDRRDVGLIFFLFFRNLTRFFTPVGRKAMSRWSRDRVTRIVLRDLLVKFFFLPLMVTFMFQEFGNLAHTFPQLFDYRSFWSSTNLNRIYWTIFHAIFIMDVSLSSIGYACSSRWLDNKSRSVEPTCIGWVVAVGCYPPFNQALGQYLPYQYKFGGSPYLDLTALPWLPDGLASSLNYFTGVGLAGFALVCYMVFVWATMSFGLRFSNLTNRGIITRGPYAWCRHPAYAAKNLAWWAESIRSFSSPWQFLFLLGWNIIYFWRARTEENHLRKDSAYRLYCSHVKYKFFPGLW